VLEGQQRIQLGPSSGTSRFSLEDTALQLKGVLRDGSLQGLPGPSIAIETGVLLPTVNAEQGVGASLTVIFSQRFPSMSFHVNVGAMLTRAGNAAFEGGLILEGPSAWPLRPVGEFVVGHETGARTEFSLLAGGIWRVGEDFTLDAALRGARESGHTVGEVRMGFTWSFTL
jgi:hypothetical protein